MKEERECVSGGKLADLPGLLQFSYVNIALLSFIFANSLNLECTPHLLMVKTDNY